MVGLWSFSAGIIMRINHSEDTDMNWKIGDRILANEPSDVFTGTITRISNPLRLIDPLYLYIKRDDGVEGVGDDGSWITNQIFCTLIEGDGGSGGSCVDHAPVEVIYTPAKNNGYEPDGFNPDAFREFMRENFR